MSIFSNKQPQGRTNPFGSLGVFSVIEVTEFGHRMGVNNLKISTFINGQKIKEEPFSEELVEEKTRKDIPVVWSDMYPEEYEKMPTTKLILGRLELPRLGLFEEL